MNRHERRAQAATSRADGLLDRQHLIEANEKEIAAIDATAPQGNVIVIADTRDEIARRYAKVAGKTEAEIDRDMTPFVMARMIPTLFLSVPRSAALELTALHAPVTSQSLRTIPDAQRVVLVISAGGTSMALHNAGAAE